MPRFRSIHSRIVDRLDGLIPADGTGIFPDLFTALQAINVHRSCPHTVWAIYSSLFKGFRSLPNLVWNESASLACRTRGIIQDGYAPVH